jgi:Domain of unknown function (DUF4267)
MAFTPSPIPSYVLGGVFVAFGLLPFFSLKKDHEAFGLPLESPSSSSSSTLSGLSDSDKKAVTAPAPRDVVVRPYAYARGIRDVTYGLAYWLLQAQGHDDAVTIFSGIVCLTAFADGLIVWLYGGERLRGKAWGHWSTLIGLATWVGWRVYRY